MHVGRPILLAALAVACAGPEAPDAAVCQDSIHRLCLAPVCSRVVDTLAVTGDASCETTLLQRTGCGDAAFTFTTPTRERFLECRSPLLRGGPDRNDRATCADVEESFDRCPDVVTFFNGGTP